MTDEHSQHTRPKPISPGNDIPFEGAQHLVAAALDRGREAGFSMSAAVVDAGGHLIAFGRADGCSLAAIEVCQVKARTAVAFGTATADLPAEMAAVMGAAATAPVALVPGGVPLGAAGRLVGALGVAGGSPDMDGQVAASAMEEWGG